MVETSPRVIGTLVGDIVNGHDARIKYGLFFEALGRQLPLVDVYDATLSGLDKVVNAVQVFHPDRYTWKQRFYKNIPAFRLRSKRTAAHLRQFKSQADVALQLGVLFDSSLYQNCLPTVIYTDFTARLSAEKPEAGRSPFSDQERKQWIALERDAYENAFHICTRSDVVRDSIVEDYGIPGRKVSVIGGGVNLAELPEPVLPSGRTEATVLFIGKDFYRKGGDLLLQAFVEARTLIPSARLVLVTNGPMPEGIPLDGVEVIEPTWDREAIKALYAHADIFVLPSRLETWGDVLLEAMAFGLPCIGATQQAMGEIVLHDKTGLIVEPGNVQGLTAALLWLLTNPRLREKYGKAGRERLEQHFTWDRVVEKLLPVLYEAATIAKTPVIG